MSDNRGRRCSVHGGCFYQAPDGAYNIQMQTNIGYSYTACSPVDNYTDITHFNKCQKKKRFTYISNSRNSVVKLTVIFYIIRCNYSLTARKKNPNLNVAKNTIKHFF